MYYLAYDVETANAKDQGSICQVGWVLFSNQGIVRTGGSLINPESAFSPVCVKVHGITAADVADAPTFPQYWESTLRELMLSALVVAYNATFDIRATALDLRRYRIPDPGIDYVDLLAVSRDLVPTEKHTLANAMTWACMDFDHHAADADAMAIFRLMNAIRRYHRLHCVGEVLQRGRAVISTSTAITLPDAAPAPCVEQPPEVPAVSGDGHALDGLCFCVTGDLFDGAGREQVEALITANGGIVKASMSKKIRYLVCGDYRDYPAGYQSTKARRADELRQAGQQLDNITYSVLLYLIEAGR